jgi:ABC-type iron transport system FetAB permease component
LGYIALIPALGFLIIYMFNLRKTGLETGNKEIWWNDIRVIHGLLYLCFALYAIKQKRYAWVALLLDVILGMVAFSLHYCTK